MTRVKKGVVANRKRERVLAQTKGFKWRRKQRKRDFRSLWQVRIGAMAKENGTSYSKLISGLKTKKIMLNRKMLADLASNNPAIFKKVIGV